MEDGRQLRPPAKPYVPPETPAGKVNVTDPDSRNVKTPRGYMQGYNAQAVVGENQIVIAAEVNADSAGLRAPGADGHRRRDTSSRRPVSPRPPRSSSPIPATGIRSRWRTSSARGIQVLIPPDAGKRRGTRPGWDGGLYAFMRRVLESELGGALYRKRQGMIEPVFGQIEVQPARSIGSNDEDDPPRAQSGD